MKKPSCMILIGIPASGKSTYARSKSSYVYVSADAIREEFYGSAAEQGDGRRVFKEVYNRIFRASSELKDIIVDNTNVKAKDRKAILALLHKTYHVTYLVFNTPLETCILRNNLRERKVPEEVIRRMHNALQQNLPLLAMECNDVVYMTSGEI